MQLINYSLFFIRFRTMDKPTASSMADENSCIICIHLGSSSASIERQDGLLPHLQTEFVYAHSSCRQKYINKKYIGMYKNKARENLSLSPPKKNFKIAKISITSIGKKIVFFADKKLIKQQKQN